MTRRPDREEMICCTLRSRFSKEPNALEDRHAVPAFVNQGCVSEGPIEERHASGMLSSRDHTCAVCKRVHVLVLFHVKRLRYASSLADAASPKGSSRTK